LSTLFSFPPPPPPPLSTLSLHDALPICGSAISARDATSYRREHSVVLDQWIGLAVGLGGDPIRGFTGMLRVRALRHGAHALEARSEEHTSELQSRGHLVCRLLLEKKKQI